MKKIRLACTSLALLGVISITTIATSCKGKGSILPKIDVNWRTEDLECNVGNPISSTREWIWITQPSVLGGVYSVDNYKDGLPPGILLNEYTGQLTGTPTQIGEWQVRFTYQVDGYQVNTSNVIDFLVSNHVDTVPVTWAGDINIDHNTSFSNLNVGTSIYTGGTYTIREGFRDDGLPTGVNFSNGLLSGNATIGGQETSISYEYTCHGWNKNVSDIYKIYVRYVHNLSITGLSLNYGSDTYTIDQLNLTIRNLNNAQFGFATTLQYLFDNGYRNNSHRYSASGTCEKNGTTYDTIDSVYCIDNSITRSLVVHFQNTSHDPKNFLDNQSLVITDTVV